MSIPKPKGVFDILPDGPTEPWQASALWQYLEGAIHRFSKLYGLREIRTPMFERTELFKRGVGEASDIVSKEMYTFEDKGGRSMSLRPEGTAPVVRAFLEHNLQQLRGVQKYYYVGPMFRYERQQAGRYRQHHQFGVEVIGDDAPERDVELIDLLMTLFQQLGLSHLTLQINSIGDEACRNSFRSALKDSLRPKLSTLSEDSIRRFETNPLRILDSKSPQDQAAIVAAPSILDFLSSSCRDHFEQVQKGLHDLGIPCTVNPHLVRGLDYYTRTVFEITAGELGAQNSLVGGGRYDTLIQTLEGPDLPALGFGCGIERVLQTMLGQQVALPKAPHATITLIPLDGAARSRAFRLLKQLRADDLAAEIDLSGKKLKQALKLAVQQESEFVGILGEEELAQDVIQVKCLDSHQSEQVAFDALVPYLKARQQHD